MQTNDKIYLLCYIWNPVRDEDEVQKQEVIGCFKDKDRCEYFVDYYKNKYPTDSNRYEMQIMEVE